MTAKGSESIVKVKAGTVMAPCKRMSPVYMSVTSNLLLRMVKKKNEVMAAGPPIFHEGHNMIPITPRGAVDYRDFVVKEQIHQEQEEDRNFVVKDRSHQERDDPSKAGEDDNSAEGHSTCFACVTFANARKQREEHLIGKKHKKNVAKLLQAEKAIERRQRRTLCCYSGSCFFCGNGTAIQVKLHGASCGAYTSGWKSVCVADLVRVGSHPVEEYPEICVDDMIFEDDEPYEHRSTCPRFIAYRTIVHYQ
jgi:hypothetical protein